MLAEDNLTTTVGRRAGGPVRSVVAIALIALASSCGGGSSGSDPSGSSGSDAVQKCKDLSQLKCERVVECGGMPSVPTCLADIQKSEYCDHAVGVTSSYNACVQDLRAISCTDLLASGAWNLPLACMGVILA
jgi:hypothetical protein